MFRAFMGPSSGVFQSFLCHHLVHAVLCWSSACVSGLVCGGDFGVTHIKDARYEKPKARKRVAVPTELTRSTYNYV